MAEKAVLEKLSYMLIGRSDVEGLMRLHPSNVLLQKSHDEFSLENNVSDAETVEVEIEMSDLLLGLRPIKQTWRDLWKTTSWHRG